MQTVGDHFCQLGEGPVWDARRSEICWIDIPAGVVHQYATKSGVLRSVAVGEMTGCIALYGDDHFIIATQSGIGKMDRTTGRVSPWVDPEIHLPGNRFNDGKCDPAGRFWAGTMALDETAGAGSVYCFDGREVVKKITDVTISNGMAWQNDHKTLYYIDTPTFEVVAYPFDLSTGNIGEKRRVISISPNDGFPDGMTIDKEGMLWIAHWDGWKITRWNPHTGKKIHEILFPVARITSCTFGGEHLRDLYVTSARAGLSATDLEKQPLAGALLVIPDCGVEGMPTFEFNHF